MAVLFSNNASATLSSGISDTATSITVQAGQGALFPAPTGGSFFYATLVNSSNQVEIVKVTARTGDTMTVERGQDGTQARAFQAGDKLELRITAAALNNKVDRDTPAFNGDPVVAKANPAVTLNKPASGQSAVLVGQKGGATRWAIALGDHIAESGGNTGSQFSVSRYSDAGVLLGTPLWINRATGQVNLETTPQVGAQPVWHGGNFNPASKQDALGFMPVQQGGGAGQGNNKVYIGWADGRLKAQVDQTDLGNVVFDTQLGNYLPRSGGTLTGDITISRAWSPGTGAVAFGNSGQRWLDYNGSVYRLNGAPLQVPLIEGGPGNAGTLRTHGGTNTVNFRWDNINLLYRVDESLERIISYISDARIKTDIRPSEEDALSVLRNIPLYSYSFVEGLPETFKEGHTGRVPIGLIAQDLEARGLGFAVRTSNQPEGRPACVPRDLKAVQMEALVPYLIRAVQQQQEQIEALRQRVAALEGASTG